MVLKRLYSWHGNLQKYWKEKIQSRLPEGTTAIACIILTTVGLTLGLKHFGLLESLELRAYDAFVRLRADQGTDPRLLIVAITEDDLRQQQRSTMTDQTIAQVLQNLEQYQPRSIGLDLYRDLPQEPGNAALREALKSPNIITIKKLGNTESDTIPAPPGVPEERISINDLLIDPDGVIRRSLLFGKTYPAFALGLAFQYLEAEGIVPQASPQNPDDMQLGAATFVSLAADSGGYQYNDVRGYQMLLDYRTRRIARQVTLTEVLEGKLKPEWVKDKVVLIGTTAPSGKDLFYTPFSAQAQTDHQMPGVEIHAHIVSQILNAALNQRPLVGFLPEWSEGVWIGLCAVLGGALAWRVRHPVMLGLGNLALLTALGSTSFGLLTQSIWFPVVAPTIATTLAAAGTVTFRAQRSQRQHQMVMTLLGQNTSKEIADALWENRDRLLESGKLPGQKLTATLLFTDLQGFSSISEQMPPEALLEWLNEFLEVMTEEVQNYHGIINKFTGDGVMAVFGVPIPRTHPQEIAIDAQQAVACALVMGDRLTTLNQSWQQRGLFSVQMRVGIYTGPIVVGSLGGKNRLEYGVIGDSVNIASRLESCAKERHVEGCRILIAEETLIHLQDRFEVESWGAMALRGKQQLVEVYRVVSQHPSSDS
ncbi:MAG: adenylate/guanylate cyclase domain-containing protein [Oculatellaceae cyanobacterium Prado106]|jgi:CHASE2 domain-containing sensor protein|nr:adenylate/guanylate cyclase domain-containing protein [Oculatellaceae cyanobacterium Prado106]